MSEYEAGAFCCNCGYEGPITTSVGTYVYQQLCPLCVTKALKPVAQRDWDQRYMWHPEVDS